MNSIYNSKSKYWALVKKIVAADVTKSEAPLGGSRDDCRAPERTPSGLGRAAALHVRRALVLLQASAGEVDTAA